MCWQPCVMVEARQSVVGGEWELLVDVHEVICSCSSKSLEDVVVVA